MIVSTKITGDYTPVPNALLNSPFLDPIAKIIYMLLRSKGKRWVVINSYLAKALDISINTLKRYIQQLIDYGWVSRKQRRNPNNGQLLGGYDYVLHNSPQKNNVVSSVDNLENNLQSQQEPVHFYGAVQPDRQNLTPNIKQNKNNIEKITNINQPQTTVDNYSELEINAAKQYTASQPNVKNTVAYTRSVLKNNWHLPILNELLNSQRKQKYKIFDTKKGDEAYLSLVKQIKKSALTNELIAQQILTPARVIVGNPRKCLAPNYLGFLYWLYLNYPDICKFNTDEPEYLYIQFFGLLNPDKVHPNE